MWIGGLGRNPDEIVKMPIRLYNKKICLKIFVLIQLFTFGVYFTERTKWMGDENKFYSAKEYWVAGQVVYVNRELLDHILHPDNPILRPFAFLQRQIYKSGIQYIPDGDGEKFVWMNAWFIYPFSKTTVRPYFVGSKRYEPVMTEILDTCWETMHGMSNNTINDKKMYIKSQLSMPLLASYYITFQGHYTGAYIGSGERLRTNKEYFNRYKDVLSVLDKIYEGWIKNNLLQEINTKYQFVSAIRQITVLDILQSLSMSLVYFDEFYCDNPIIKRMYEEYIIAMSDDYEKNYILNYSKVNYKQANMGYLLAVYQSDGSMGRYLLSNFCNKTIPQELYILANKEQVNFYSMSSRDIEYVYKTELSAYKGERK